MASLNEKTGHPQHRSLLLSLPAELRNAVYCHVLRQPLLTEFKYVDDHDAGTADNERSHRFCANLLATCKQIHIEATPILYGQNTFAAHGSLLARMPTMVMTIRPVRLVGRPVLHHRVINQIKRYYLRVRLDTDPQFSAEQLAESFTGVEELDIEVFQPMFDSCTFAVLTLFEGIRGVGKATVRGSIGDGRYATWLACTMMMPHDSEAIRDEHIREELSRQKPYSWIPPAIAMR